MRLKRSPSTDDRGKLKTCSRASLTRSRFLAKLLLDAKVTGIWEEPLECGELVEKSVFKKDGALTVSHETMI